MPARRRPPLELEQQDGLHWPQLREQQHLTAHLPPAEKAAAAQRAALLVSQGYGAPGLKEWLNYPGQHPGERPASAPAGRREQQLADLFDDAA